MPKVSTYIRFSELHGLDLFIYLRVIIIFLIFKESQAIFLGFLYFRATRNAATSQTININIYQTARRQQEEPFDACMTLLVIKSFKKQRYGKYRYSADGITFPPGSVQ